MILNKENFQSKHLCMVFLLAKYHVFSVKITFSKFADFQKSSSKFWIISRFSISIASSWWCNHSQSRNSSNSVWRALSIYVKISLCTHFFFSPKKKILAFKVTFLEYDIWNKKYLLVNFVTVWYTFTLLKVHFPVLTTRLSLTFDFAPKHSLSLFPHKRLLHTGHDRDPDPSVFIKILRAAAKEVLILVERPRQKKWFFLNGPLLVAGSNKKNTLFCGSSKAVSNWDNCSIKVLLLLC